MGSQGPGRKRTPSKNGLTAEEDALNVIAKEAEARLAAKRAARAEAREIRMKELERQQKEADDRLERDYLEKGSSRASTISGATLTSLGGTSSRRGSGDTSISADTEASIREIKDSLLEVEEKYRKAMVSNAQLDNEKTNMMYEVDTLRDSLMELEEMLFETRRELEEKIKDLEREKHAHSVLQFQFSELKETLKQSEELLSKHGIVLGPDLVTNGETGDEVGNADPNSQTASAEIREGSSVLEIRLRKLVDERENLIEQVKRLKGQLEQKKPKNGTENSSSPDGDVLENGADSNIMDLQSGTIVIWLCCHSVFSSRRAAEDDGRKMALPLLRICNRPVSVLVRNFTSKSSLLNHSRRLAPAASVVCDVRRYSSEPERRKRNPRVVVFGIPNPIIWFRNRIYFFLIRAYFDKEFSIEEFMEGAIQAFSHVSRLLSQCQFEALEGFVAKDLIKKLEGKCAHLPLSHQRALSAEPDDIMYMTAGDVGIYYDDSERKFVSILMRFWYLTSAKFPDESVDGAKVFQVAIGDEREKQTETKRLLTANYEFQREFTEGVTPDWIITRIEHSKLID